jgi:ABC-type multidrug transport system fused ATPase/permease subunit
MKRSDLTSATGWTMIARLAHPYRRKFAVVALLALVATGTDLVAPLIYREAVNDIAGLFVSDHRRTANGSTDDAASSIDEGAPPAIPQTAAREPHRRGHVAPRTSDQTFRTLLWSVVLLFFLNILSHFCMLAADQKTVRLASQIESDFIGSTFAHVLSLPLRFFATRSSGTLAKQIDQSDEVAPVVTALAKDIVPSIISMIGVIVIMLSQNWSLTIAALALLPIYTLVVIRSSGRLQTGLARYYEMWDGVSSRIQDALGAIKTVKLSGAEEREATRFRRHSADAYQTYVERNALANRYLFLQSVLSYLSQALILGYGGWLVLKHRLTPGDVVMFVVYLDHLYAPVESLTELYVTVQEHFASLARATRLAELPTESQTGTTPQPGAGAVEFSHVCFSHVPGRPVLCDVSFHLPAKRLTALVGPSGAGKTTAADLLMRLYEPDSGAILLDGQSIGELQPSRLRHEFGVVAADGAIFRGSLAENIRYKRADATDEEITDAAHAAGLEATLSRLPEGLDTLVGEGGMGLSVGERQRLQIARAIVGRPRVLILDEATANLDYATEIAIREALLSRHEQPTTLVITHRYSMAEICSQVIVLERGRVIAQGSPADLVATCPWFADFAASARDPEPATEVHDVLADAADGLVGDEDAHATEEDDGIEEEGREI